MSIARIPIEITWTGTTGSPGVNVWHGRFDSGDPADGDLEGLTEILQDFYDTIKTCFPSSVSFKWLGEASGVGADDGEFFTSPGWTVVGTGTEGYLPPALAMYVNWRAATGGRSGRGRTFLGPLSQNLSEANGTPNDLYRGDVVTAVDNLVSASLSDLNGALGVFSRQDGLLRDFISGDVPNKFAVLTSRRD